MVLGGSHQVVGCQLRVRNVPGIGGEDRTCQLVLGRRVEVGVVRCPGRSVIAEVEIGEPRCQRFAIELFVSHAHPVELGSILRVVADGRLEYQRSAADVLGEPALVLDPAVGGPVEPRLCALVRQGDAVVGGVVEADDRTRVGRRAVAGGRELVDNDHVVAALGQLETDGASQDPGSDHDHISRTIQSGSSRRVVPSLLRLDESRHGCAENPSDIGLDRSRDRHTPSDRSSVRGRVPGWGTSGP